MDKNIDLKKFFGINVQKYRKLNKLTQERLAELVGIDATTVSLIERGKCFSSAETLLKIANALNINVPELFYFENLHPNEDTYCEILKLLELFKDDSVKLNAVKAFMHSLV